MPVAPTSRQPGAPSWFSGAEAQQLLALERAWLQQRLSALPLVPCVWIEPLPLQRALPSPLRGLLLYRSAPGYAGNVRCALPLPLPSDCVGAIVLQHVESAELAPLIEEAQRVLMDGGRLWVCGLTPWSPSRLRRPRGKAPAIAPASWNERLRQAGLQPGAPRYFGPRWRGQGDALPQQQGIGDVLRAAYVIEAEKRAASVIPPSPVRWRGSAAQLR